MAAVWLVLVKLVSLDDTTEFPRGSDLLAQCLVPVASLPDALELLPSFLEDNHFRLVDHLMAEKYRLDDPAQEFPIAKLRDWMQAASETNEVRFGMFFTSNEEKPSPS